MVKIKKGMLKAQNAVMIKAKVTYDEALRSYPVAEFLPI